MFHHLCCFSLSFSAIFSCGGVGGVQEML